MESCFSISCFFCFFIGLWVGFLVGSFLAALLYGIAVIRINWDRQVALVRNPMDINAYVVGYEGLAMFTAN